MLRLSKMKLGKNIVEKIANIAACNSDKMSYKVGDFIEIQPAYCMTHDNTDAVLTHFQKAGLTKIYDPKQLVFAIDHDIQNKSKQNLDKYARIEAFANHHGIDYYPPETGIGHQVMCEQGYVLPGTMVVASDSHSNMYGGLGCLGTPIVRTDAAHIWSKGVSWWKIPETVLVKFTGKLQPGVFAKDVILTLINTYPHQVLNYAVEFQGHESLTIEERLTIANMTTEWGCVAGVFPADKQVVNWLLESRRLTSEWHTKYAEQGYNLLYNHLWDKIRSTESDSDAKYAGIIELNLSTITPTITGPNDVALRAIATDENNKVAFDKGYIVSCTNARYDDLREASYVLQDRKVKKPLYIGAASDNIRDLCMKTGVWKIFERAGCHMLPSGCNMCIGLSVGILEDGEVAISATNRNYAGRMGSKNAKAYLASPAVVAKSCVDGYITLPQDTKPVTTYTKYIKLNDINKHNETKTKPIFLNNNDVVLLVNNDISTDAIYPGKYTYKSLSKEEQAKVVLENYIGPLHPGGTQLQKIPDTMTKFTIISGKNFGTGSSRNAAVTALQARGCQAILAVSFNHVYIRNSFNHGLLCLEILEEDYNDIVKQMTYMHDVSIDLESHTFSIGNELWGHRSYNFKPLSKVGLQLIKQGGIQLSDAK